MKHEESAMRAFALAGKDIRMALKSIYGTPEAAEKTIREQAENEGDLEQWGTIACGDVFRFADLPAPMREAAKLSMAAAMLVWKREQEGRAA